MLLKFNPNTTNDYDQPMKTTISLRSSWLQIHDFEQFKEEFDNWHREQRKLISMQNFDDTIFDTQRVRIQNKPAKAIHSHEIE